MNKNVFAHESAVIDEGAIVGEGTRIWHFTHVMAGCRVGVGCNIGQNVFLDNNVRIGNGVKIQNNVSVYNGVTIEDDVFLGPSMVFTNVINPRSFIERKQEFKPTLVQKGASIGANATILCGITIGSYALIGAGSVVTSNVKEFALVYGSPARQYGWVSKNAYPLVFNEKGEAWCEESGEMYILEKGYVRIA